VRLDGGQAVIGFSRSPFTLACYFVEGRPSREYAVAKAFMYRASDAWPAGSAHRICFSDLVTIGCGN
jgi:uroporphyrinogen-III decarboxylase